MFPLASCRLRGFGSLVNGLILFGRGHSGGSRVGGGGSAFGCSHFSTLGGEGARVGVCFVFGGGRCVSLSCVLGDCCLVGAGFGVVCGAGCFVSFCLLCCISSVNSSVDVACVSMLLATWLFSIHLFAFFIRIVICWRAEVICFFE